MHPLLTKCFGFDPKITTVRTEVLAGISTFLTMAYILAVNPTILATTGMDKGSLFTATALSSAVASLLMGFYAKMPIGLMPGMGINAFFAFTLCLTLGYSWQFALTAVFLEGIIFILLTVTNVREIIVQTVPPSLRSAIAAGIGLFIAFIGLQAAGISVKHDATLVAGGDLFTPQAGLAILGLFITSVLLIKHVTGALLLGICITALCGIPFGLTHLDGFISLPPSLDPTFFKFEFHNIFTSQMVIAVLTLLYMDLFDTMGTAVSLMIKAGLAKDGKFPRLKQVFLVDAIGTTVGAIFGTSAITSCVESAVGVSVGGKTGLTAFVVGIGFLLSLIFAPLFLAVPAQATAPVLILVGLMMMTCVQDIPLEEYAESIPAFVCIICIPLTYSIANGIVFGLLSYVIINFLCGNFYKLNWQMYILAICFIILMIVK